MLHLTDKKITIVSPSAPPFGGGGVSSAHYNLFRVMRDRGYQVELVTFADPPTASNGSGIVRFGTHSITKKLIRLALFAYLKARGASKTAYQLEDILTELPGVKKMAYYINSHLPDVVILPDRCLPALNFRKNNCRRFVVAHHNPARFIGNPLIGDFCPLDARLAISLEQRSLEGVSGIICPSNYMLGFFRQTFQYDGPITVIPNLVDQTMIDSIPAFNLRDELELSDTAPLVYLPSAGSQIKGAAYIFEIIRRLSARSVKPMGFYLSGALSPALQAELAYLPSQARLYAPGSLPFVENIALAKGCTFGVSPTLVENFSMALLEAVYCGLPMVAFDTGGTAEIIVQEQNGFLVPYLDIEQMITYSIRLLDVNFSAEMGLRAGSFTRQQFDAGAILDRLDRFVFPGADNA